MTVRLTTFFPFFAILGVGAAILFPDAFLPLKITIVPLLGLVMFGMGMTLTFANFLEVAKRPILILLGLVLQFLIMPLAGFLVATGFGLAPMLVAGVVLVGSCPGGTASNVITYLARGDVALSITLTAVSTCLAILATPVLTWLYVGQSVSVPVLDMLLSILKIVLLPVGLGVLVNQLFGHTLGPMKEIFPLVSVIAIVLIIAIIVALNQAEIATLGLVLCTVVILHNFLGLAGGYGITRLLGFDERTSRTLAIEVGMQNSGLGVTLAVQYFSATAALPGALFSVWHNLSGAALASLWSRRT